MAQEVIVVGASARAAAWSALRAGFTAWTADLFADRDLCRVASAITVAPQDYPLGLVRALHDAPVFPWLYTGALENRPGLIEEISRRLPLWGNGPEVLRRVRSPFRLAESLCKAGLPSPAVARIGDTTRRWLMKPFASAAGRDIEFWHSPQQVGPRHYLQEWIDGVPCAAAFLGRADGTAQLIGVTRQLIGADWGEKGRPFCYRGSVGPLPLAAEQRDVYQRLGNALVRDIGLRGLFGVDCVVRDEVPWTVEVNPRYTASMEILEWAGHLPLLAWHAAEFCSRAVDLSAPPVCGSFLGKAIAYADHPGVFPEDGPWNEVLANPWLPWEMPAYADIPRPGQQFEAGQPVITVFAKGDSVDECIRRLQEHASRFLRLAFASSSER